MSRLEKTEMILSNEQLRETAKRQFEFLAKVHPSLTEDCWVEGAVEIRPVHRGEAKYKRSFHTWSLEEKDLEKYTEYLSKINGETYCMYYSVFAFDYHKETEGYQKGKINNENSLYTSALVIDFDNITLEEFKEYLVKLAKLDIETLSVFSGNGFQSVILLDQKVYDKKILEKFTKLLISRGFPVDESIKESARVMRLPYSFNCKKYDKKYRKPGEEPFAIATRIVAETNRRYKLVDIFKKIKSLDVVIEDDEEVKIDELENIEIRDFEPIEKAKKKKKKQEKIEKRNIIIKEVKEDYKEVIDFERLEPGIQNMLIETEHKYRNKVLLFLVCHFKHNMGLDMNRVEDIMAIWGEHCNPSLEEDYVREEARRVFKKGYKTPYTEDLGKKFGFIDFNSYSRDNKVRVTNEFFEYYHVMSDAAVKIYLMMMAYEKVEEIHTWTQEEICRVADISRRTFYRYVTDLIKLGFVDKRRSYKRENEEYKYFINKFFNMSRGFTEFETATLENMVFHKNKALNDNEIKLYSYLIYMINTKKTDVCFASQGYLGKAIGKAQNSISRITDELNDKKYIIKTTTKEKNVMHTEYKLKY